MIASGLFPTSRRPNPCPRSSKPFLDTSHLPAGARRVQLAPNCAAKQETRSSRALFPKNTISRSVSFPAPIAHFNAPDQWSRARRNSARVDHGTLCSLKLHSPKEVTLFAVKCMESRTIKTNLLVWIQVEAICRGASTVPLRSNGRLAQKTPDRAMKFPSSNTFLIIEDKQLQRINSADVQIRVRRIFTERPARRSRWNKKKRGPSFGRKAGARCSLRRVQNAGNAFPWDTCSDTPPRFASPHQRLVPRAFYSHIFLLVRIKTRCTATCVATRLFPLKF
jgi:hypothetical protein